MTSNSSTGNDSTSIFEKGKLKPGIYKIQSIYTDTYLDIELHSRDLCCRPAKDLGGGRGLVRLYPSSVVHASDNSKWEIKQLGPGYTVQRFDPGEPEQFCTPLDGLQDGTTLRVCAYPVPWRVETVNNDNYRGLGFVRFYWATKKIVWDLASGYKDNGAKVVACCETGTAWQMWKLVPERGVGAFIPQRSLTSVKTLEPGSLPSYEAGPGRSSTCAQHAESERDEFSTIVDEVTVVTTTTRRRYRVEDA